MKLSIIIVNFNSGPITRSCLESVLKQNYQFEYEIIVVDNASSDESVLLLRSDFPEINVIANKKNVGLAAGVNIGLRHAKGEYRLVLNPDIIVMPQGIETLVKYLDENKDVGMAGGKLISPNGHMQYSCYRFYSPMTIVYRRTWLDRVGRGRQAVRDFLMKDYDHQIAKDVDWLMGSCLMVRSIAQRQVGGMDERFFLYFEDVDWCRRYWESGWRVAYVPEAKFSHFYQRSSDKGGLIGIFTNKSMRIHITSAFKYFWKYRGRGIPRKS